MMHVYFSFTENLKWIFLLVANSRLQSTEMFRDQADRGSTLLNNVFKFVLSIHIPPAKAGRNKAEEAHAFVFVY